MQGFEIHGAAHPDRERDVIHRIARFKLFQQPLAAAGQTTAESCAPAVPSAAGATPADGGDPVGRGRSSRSLALLMAHLSFGHCLTEQSLHFLVAQGIQPSEQIARPDDPGSDAGIAGGVGNGDCVSAPAAAIRTIRHEQAAGCRRRVTDVLQPDTAAGQHRSIDSADGLPNPPTVCTWNSTCPGTASPRCSCRPLSRIVACNESPPNSKKLSCTPMGSRPQKGRPRLGDVGFQLRPRGDKWRRQVRSRAAGFGPRPVRYSKQR